LRSRSIPFELRPLLAGYGGFNASIHVTLLPAEGLGEPARESSISSFVLAVPLSAGEGEALPFGVETALAYIEELRSSGTGREVRVAFLGDEGTALPPDTARNIHAGLEDLAALPEIPEDTFLWYLDLPSPPEGLVVHHGANKAVAPLNLLAPLPGLSRSWGVPYSLAIGYNEIYKLGLAEGPSALTLTRSRGINALYVSGEPGTGERPLSAGTLAKLLAEYTAVLDTRTENLDTHFSIIRLPGKAVFFIPEGAAVGLLFLSTALFLLYQGIYAIWRRKTAALRRAVFIRHSWLLLLFLILLWGALLAAGRGFSLMCRILRLPLPPRYDAAALCFLLAVLLFSLTSLWTDRIHIPRKEIFYGNAALFLVGAGVLFAAAVNITFIPVFVWAFCFILIGTRVRIPALVFAAALVTPLAALAALINIMEAGSQKLARAFLAGDGIISLYLALVSLPFILLIKRGTGLLRKHRPRPPLRRALLLHLVLTALNLAALGLYAGRLSENQGPPSARRTSETGAAPLLLTFTDRVFLESRILKVRLEAPGNPARFDLYLESGVPDRAPEIYSAPMPAFNAGGGVLSFILSEGPPNPFEFELVLPLNFSGILRAEALYGTWDPAVDRDPPPPGPDYLLTLDAALPIGETLPRGTYPGSAF
jgi:hypothetical protein